MPTLNESAVQVLKTAFHEGSPAYNAMIAAAGSSPYLTTLLNAFAAQPGGAEIRVEPSGVDGGQTNLSNASANAR
jgi:hypothetical protein